MQKNNLLLGNKNSSKSIIFKFCSTKKPKTTLLPAFRCRATLFACFRVLHLCYISDLYKYLCSTKTEKLLYAKNCFVGANLYI